jgi:hypothetical protein
MHTLAFHIDHKDLKSDYLEEYRIKYKSDESLSVILKRISEELNLPEKSFNYFFKNKRVTNRIWKTLHKEERHMGKTSPSNNQLRPTKPLHNFFTTEHIPKENRLANFLLKMKLTPEEVVKALKMARYSFQALNELDEKMNGSFVKSAKLK